LIGAMTAARRHGEQRQVSDSRSVSLVVTWAQREARAPTFLPGRADQFE
jgi:hypothetical protein